MDTATDTKLTFLCAVAVHAEIEDLIPQFTRRHGIEVGVNYDVNPAVAKRVMAGEAFDVGLNNPWYVEEMIKHGLVMPDIHVPFGRVPLTVGAAGSEPKEIVSSPEAVRDLLLNADSIAYTSIGTSGKTFLRAIENMGVQDQIRGRLRPMGAGEPPIAAAKGEVQYAIAPLSRIIAAPGVVPVATFATELGLDIDMSMFVHKNSRTESALRLIEFLSDPEFDAYLQSHGVYRYELKGRARQRAAAAQAITDASTN
jgi:molybdate transport system substrate-binding protein